MSHAERGVANVRGSAYLDCSIKQSETVVGGTVTNYFEISNDPTSDTHILVESGYAGKSDEELQAMSDQVKKANEIRKAQAEELMKVRRDEEDRLVELERANPPWKKQRDKYAAKKLSEGTGKQNEPLDPKHRGDGKKKGGCQSCAAKGLKRLITGGAALLKSELGIDAADEETIATRKKQCLECEHQDLGVCTICTCFCSAKIRLAKESCPDDPPRW